MSPGTEKTRVLAAVRYWAERTAFYTGRGHPAPSVGERLEQAVARASKHGWAKEAAEARARGLRRASKTSANKGTPFSAVPVGATFDFIDPNTLTGNSFFHTCTKTGPRSYSWEGGHGKRLHSSVGTTKVRVFHVLRASRLGLAESDPRRTHRSRRK